MRPNQPPKQNPDPPRKPNDAHLPPVLVIFGPTSSGKTKLSLEIAEALPAKLSMEVEIVGADSRQVYAGMNIGTSKVSRDIMLQVPHHGLDLRPPDKMLSLAEYQAFTIARIQEIHERGRLPVLVGGTGSYTQSVIENWNVGEELLHNEENFRARGKSNPLFRAAYIRPDTTLNNIHRRIDLAIERMLEEGLVEEVIALAEKYRLWEPNRLQKSALWYTHGYREFLEAAHTFKPVRFLPTRRELPAIVEAIKEHTRAYSVRQWSWYKKMPFVTPFATGREAIPFLRTFLTAPSPPRLQPIPEPPSRPVTRPKPRPQARPQASQAPRPQPRSQPRHAGRTQKPRRNS